MAEDLESLDSFTLTVRRPGCEVRYGGCVWTRLERSARGNGLLLEKAEIMAFSRTVSHMEGVKTGWNTEDKE